MKNELKKPNIERLLTTMKGGIADRVPNYEILLEGRNVKALLGADLGTTMAASRGATADALYNPPMEAGHFAQICQLTGDADKPESERLTWTILDHPYNTKSELLPSGLLGPVQLTTVSKRELSK